MKKRIALTILLSVIFLVSCSSFKDNQVPMINDDKAFAIGKFEVFEFGDFDNLSGANHSKEIDLSKKSYKKEMSLNQNTIKFNNKDINATYDETEEGYLYGYNRDFYKSKNGKETTVLGVSNIDGKVDYYSWVSSNYVDSIDEDKLTRDKCFEIAKEYLNKFIDSSEYELVGEKTWEIPEFEELYSFEFRRVIDDIKTSDYASIRVTCFGDVVGHSFISLGEMKDATIPSESDLKLIEENVDKKIQDIYSNVTEKYSVSYEIPDPLFIRMAAGRYAFEYFVEVDLTPKDDTEHTISEVTKLLVYVD